VGDEAQGLGVEGVELLAWGGEGGCILSGCRVDAGRDGLQFAGGGRGGRGGDLGVA